MTSKRLVIPSSPRKQHLVSQVLLRRFAVGGKLEAWSLEHPQAGWRNYPPSAVGYEKDFVRVDADTIEQVWGEVEARLPPALADLDSGALIAAGTDTEAALLDCLALHWARNLRVRDVAVRAWEKVRHASHHDLQERPELLDRSFFQLTGLYSAGPQARAIANDRLHEGPEDIASGRHFATRVVDFFEHARDRLTNSHVEVYDVPDEADDLLLSDSPVIAPRRGERGLGAGFVALADVRGFAMPIGPRTAISAHEKPTRLTVTNELPCVNPERFRRPPRAR